MSSTPELNSASNQATTYQPLFKLGEGGMAEVVLATAEGPNDFRKLVVLKRLLPQLALDANMREAFLFEARLTARMNHPNVVHVVGVVEIDEVSVIVMEYLEGQPLSSLVARSHLARELQLYVLAELLSGLDHVHELTDVDGRPLEAVHRDVSPENVVVTYDGGVKLVDFGIAKSAVLKRQQTAAGVLKGKLRYMAPEQLIAEPVDRRTDLFSVGVMLWNALSGRCLWQGMTEREQLRALINGELPQLRRVQPGLPEDLYRAVEWATRPDRDARISSARELRRLLLAGLRELGTVPTRDDLAEFMQTRCASERDELRLRIAAALAPQSTTSSTSVATPASESRGKSSACGSDRPADPTTVTAIREQPTRQVVIRPLPATSQRERRLLRVGFAVGLMTALAGLAAFYFTPPSESRVVRTEPVSGPSGLAAPSASSAEPRPSRTPCALPSLIDDFEDGDTWLCAGEGRGDGQWIYFSDGTGSTHPPSGARPSPTLLVPPRGPSRRGLHVSGQGLSAYGAGLALRLAAGKDYDVSSYTGVSLWLKASSPLPIDVKLATRATLESAYGGRCVSHANAWCDDHFSGRRTVITNWGLYLVSFDELKQQGWGTKATWDPREVVELHIRIPRDPIPDAGLLSFDVFIDDISFYKANAMPSTTSVGAGVAVDEH